MNKKISKFIFIIVCLFFFNILVGCDEINEIIDSIPDDPIIIIDEGNDDEHSHNYQEDVFYPGCVEFGYTVFTCDCGDMYIDNYVDPSGHKWDDGVVFDSTCEESGYILYTCLNDSTHSKKEEIEPKGHKQKDEYELNIKETCTENGEEVLKCVDCEKVLATREILAHHNMSEEFEVLTNPTCTDNGTNVKRCTECKEILESVKTDPLGHNEKEGVITLEATCLKDGVMSYNCSRCDALLRTENVDMLGHKQKEEYTIITSSSCIKKGSATYNCERCNIVLETIELGYSDHKSYTIPQIDPKCNVDGVASGTRCLLCMATLSGFEVIPATGHIPSDEKITTLSTCSVSGHADTMCKVCGELISSEKLPTLPHTPYELLGIEATCTKDGLTPGSRCRVCEEIVEGLEVIKALGHDVECETFTTLYGHSYDEAKCKRCKNTYRTNLVLDYTKLYGYNYLLNTYANGSKYAGLYKEFYDASIAFLSDTKDYTSENSYISIATSYYSCDNKYCLRGHNKYNITLEEAASVWKTFTMDNPQFMFLWNGYTYGSSTCSSVVTSGTAKYINLCISSDYFKYEDRAEIMKKLDIVNSEVSYTFSHQQSEIYVAQAIHNEICFRMDYAYEADGTTPSSTKNAHNMVGFLMENSGVCESFAKTFQYYCYLYGVYSIQVTGDNHMWNMIRIDDKWFGVDCTWDDGGKNNSYTYKYTYFGAGTTKMNANGNHTPYSDEFGIRFQIPIPTMSVDSVSITVGNVITVPGTTTENIAYIIDNDYL